jgi:fucose permease
LIIAVGRHAAITIGGAWLMGFLGTLLLTTIQSSLADRHGPHRAIALTESNIAASVFAGLAPLFVGGFDRIGIGWRSALYVMALVWALALWGFRDEPVPAARSEPAETEDTTHQFERRLPGVFWAYWLVLFFCVAAEWSIVSWGADFLVEARDLRKADASMVMTLFFVAMVIGRVSGSRFSRQMDTSRLLLVAIGISITGFVLFWLTPLVALSIVGLFVAGLGVANLFPFLLSIAVGTAADQSDRASARVALGAGLAILLAPQILGTTADQTSIQTAYALIFGIFCLAVGVTVFANRLAARHNREG